MSMVQDLGRRTKAMAAQIVAVVAPKRKLTVIRIPVWMSLIPTDPKRNFDGSKLC
jgi:hypothetical protein